MKKGHDWFVDVPRGTIEDSAEIRDDRGCFETRIGNPQIDTIKPPPFEQANLAK
jgi:hypothetical protein